jgi:hypothetical protein
MHCLRSCFFAGSNDAIHTQIRLSRWWWSNANGLIGDAHMTGLGIRLRINRYRLDPQPFSGQHHSASNFTAVSN